jgi:hypothetical protein
VPVSAYLKAGLFLVAAAAALFGAAGTVAIPGFWAYLAILAAVMIVSFANAAVAVPESTRPTCSTVQRDAPTAARCAGTISSRVRRSHVRSSGRPNARSQTRPLLGHEFRRTLQTV